MKYSFGFSSVVPGAAVADTYRTIAAIRLPANTPPIGVRARITQISLGFAQDAPADIPIGVKLVRIADVSAGGAGTPGLSGTLTMKDPASLQNNFGITAGLNYTAEPTAYETGPLWAIDINDRNAVIKEWIMDDEKPKVIEDQIIGLLVAPRTSTVVEVSGCIEFELY